MKEFKLGKQDYVEDKRTLQLATFFDPLAVLDAPSRYDFDHRRTPFPNHVWGNDAYGDCVFADQANALVRIERKETRRTPRLTDEDVIAKYKQLTGCVQPGDFNDRGYSMLYGFRDWRNNGWTVNGHNYRIDAFGELNPTERGRLDAATYILGGIHLGILLPLSALEQLYRGEPWDVVEGPDAVAGSWGGHALYSKRYDPRGRYAKTWGMEVYMTDNFIRTYCDEAWGVVDSLNVWGKRHDVDVAALRYQLHAIGARNIEEG